MRYVLWVFLFSTTLLRADSNTFSSSRVNSFYDTFVCEEKDDAAFVDLTGPCSGSANGIPPVPPPLGPGYMPITIVNNSGHADSLIYFTIFGHGVTVSPYSVSGSQSYVDVVNHILVTPTAANTPPSESYTYQLSSIAQTNGQYVIYVPYLSSGIILMGIRNTGGGGHPAPFNGLTGAAGSITNPIPYQTTDNNYYTAFSFGEITFLPPSSNLDQMTIDYSCVDYYSLSLYMQLYKGNNVRTTGTAQARSTLMGNLTSTFSNQTLVPTAHGRTVWNTLSTETVAGAAGTFTDGLPIRILSPGSAMGSNVAGLFETNYFSDTALTSDGDSWALDVWTGSPPFYATASNFYLNLNISYTPYQTTVPLSVLYLGYMNSLPSTFIFQSSNAGPTTGTVFYIPFSDTNGINSTSCNIFNTPDVFYGMQYSIGLSGSQTAVPTDPTSITQNPYTLQAIEITKELAACINSGMIPLPNTSFYESGPTNSQVQNLFYKNSQYLTSGSNPGGPWYNLYSKALIGDYTTTGDTFYTYTYDDYLYRQAAGFNVTAKFSVVDPTTHLVITVEP